MSRLGRAAEFEDIQHANQIGADIGFRVLDAVTHARLGGEVNDDVRLACFGRSEERLRILEPRLDKREAGRLVERRNPLALQPDVVVGRDCIEPDDGVPAPQETARNMVADEAGASGDQKVHQAVPFGATR